LRQAALLEIYCDHSVMCCGDPTCGAGHRGCGCGYDPDA
jgi:hypothetical protein